MLGPPKAVCEVEMVKEATIEKSYLSPAEHWEMVIMALFGITIVAGCGQSSYLDIAQPVAIRSVVARADEAA